MFANNLLAGSKRSNYFHAINESVEKITVIRLYNIDRFLSFFVSDVCMHKNDGNQTIL